MFAFASYRDLSQTAEGHVAKTATSGARQRLPYCTTYGKWIWSPVQLFYDELNQARAYQMTVLLAFIYYLV